MDLVAQYIYRREGPFSTGPSFQKFLSGRRSGKKDQLSPLVQLFDPWHMVEKIGKINEIGTEEKRK